MSAFWGKVISSKDHWLLGVADSDVVGPLGNCLGEFENTSVYAESRGGVAALFCEAPVALRWPARRADQTDTSVLPILAAISALVPFLPVLPGTRISGADTAGRLMADRGPELIELIDQHADCLQVEIGGHFDAEAAKMDVSARGSLSELLARSQVEADLIERTHSQAVTGRRADLEIRLRRMIYDIADEVVELAPATPSQFARRKFTFRRSRRKELSDFLALLSAGGQTGAVFDTGAFIPATDFLSLSIESADPGSVESARRELNLGPVTARPAIHTAYSRALERVYPGRRDRAKAQKRLQKLETCFRNLDLVAEGQIRAARGGREMPVHLSGDQLERTFILDFKLRGLGCKAA